VTDASDRFPSSPAPENVRPLDDDDISSMAATVAVESQPAFVGHLDEALAQVATGERYETRRLLGQGGMGEVHLCADRRIGREIAMKLLRMGPGSSSAGTTRFVREARVQGQLEHPAVVPVYDLGLTEGGTEFFTMKRVSGITLADVLQQLRSGDAEAERSFTRNKLLGMFRQVCLGVHYAHSRGVIHRDLKPGNLMLGDFGEVYIIDWGLAKVRDADGDGTVSDAAQTMAGAILGTPGYMPPEQALSSVSVDERADVYALGAMLFEVLTLEPLHQGKRVHELLRSTQAGVDVAARVAECARDVPPELARLCEEATQAEHRHRLASAEALAEGIEAFLEGDRDLVLRRELAERHATRAGDLARQALDGAGASEELRQEALQAAGRALALDPGSTVASATLLCLLTQPPTELPEKVQDAITGAEADEARAASLFGAFAYSGFAVVVIAMTAFLEVLSWRWVVAAVAPLGGAVALCVHFARRQQQSPIGALLIFLLSSLAVGAASGIASPWLIVPGLAAVNTMALNIGLTRSLRLPFLAIGCLAVTSPVALELLGFIGHSFTFDANSLTVVGRSVHIDGNNALFALAAMSIATVVIPTLVVWRTSDVLAKMRETVYLQAWQLEQLVPSEAIARGSRA
jgi:eukaryotic-like serine/threonine-protein kinase